MKDSREPNFIVLNEPRHFCLYVNCLESAKYTGCALPWRIWTTEPRFISV